MIQDFGSDENDENSKKATEKVLTTIKFKHFNFVIKTVS